MIRSSIFKPTITSRGWLRFDPLLTLVLGCFQMQACRLISASPCYFGGLAVEMDLTASSVDSTFSIVWSSRSLDAQELGGRAR